MWRNSSDRSSNKTLHVLWVCTAHRPLVWYGTPTSWRHQVLPAERAVRYGTPTSWRHQVLPVRNAHLVTSPEREERFNGEVYNVDGYYCGCPVLHPRRLLKADRRQVWMAMAGDDLHYRDDNDDNDENNSEPWACRRRKKSRLADVRTAATQTDSKLQGLLLSLLLLLLSSLLLLLSLSLLFNIIITRFIMYLLLLLCICYYHYVFIIIIMYLLLSSLLLLFNIIITRFIMDLLLLLLLLCNIIVYLIMVMIVLYCCDM